MRHLGGMSQLGIVTGSSDFGHRPRRRRPGRCTGPARPRLLLDEAEGEASGGVVDVPHLGQPRKRLRDVGGDDFGTDLAGDAIQRIRDRAGAGSTRSPGVASPASVWAPASAEPPCPIGLQEHHEKMPWTPPTAMMCSTRNHLRCVLPASSYPESGGGEIPARERRGWRQTGTSSRLMSRSQSPDASASARRLQRLFTPDEVAEEQPDGAGRAAPWSGPVQAAPWARHPNGACITAQILGLWSCALV